MLALLAVLPILALAAPTAERKLAKRYSGVLIQANRDGKCLSVSGNQHATFTDGSGVYSVDCAVATTWDINPGSGSVLAHNAPQFALDAGSTPGNNGGLKIWTSYPGLYQQTWYLTDDKRIAITGGDQCLDEGDNGIQTYRCTTGNTNQSMLTQHARSSRSKLTLPVFNIVQPGGTTTSSTGPTTTPGPTSSSSTTPSPSASVYPPVGEAKPDPPTGGRRLHPNGRNDLCLGATNGFAGQGTPLEIIYCHNNDDYFVDVELFTLPTPGSTGPIKLKAKPNLCVDAGSNPGDGGDVKLWQCYDGLPQQTWTFNAENGAISLANNQCLDVERGSTGGQQKPYGYYQNVQTWTCSNNIQQIWGTYNP